MNLIQRSLMPFLSCLLLIMHAVAAMAAGSDCVNMPVPNLVFSALPSMPVQEGSRLDISIKNQGNSTFSGVIHIKLPEGLASGKGADQDAFRLDTGAWTLSRSPGSSPDFFVIDLAPPEKSGLEAGKQIALSVALEKPRAPISHTLLGSYSAKVPDTGELCRSSSQRLQVQLKPVVSDHSLPTVSFFTDRLSPTTLKPGQPVELIWKTENAYRVELFGPLPNGAHMREIPAEARANGKQPLIATGHATYRLKADVRDRAGNPHTIERTLTLDTQKTEHQISLNLSPATVLPNGEVSAHWVAGLQPHKEAQALALTWSGQDGYRRTRKLSVEQFGWGQFSFTAPRAAQREEDTTVRLTARDQVLEKRFEIARWQFPENKTWVSPETQGKPLGLAYLDLGKNGEKNVLALCTEKGMWLAEVGMEKNFADFVPAALAPNGEDLGACRSLRTHTHALYVLYRLKNGKHELRRYGAGEKTPLQEQGTALTLPAAFNSPTMQNVDFAVQGTRLYIWGSRQAYSIGIATSESGHANWVEEPWLQFDEFAPNWKAFVLENRFYALDTRHGTLLHYPATQAAMDAPGLGAPEQLQTSPVGGITDKVGVMVETGGVLAMLGGPLGMAGSAPGVVQDVAFNPRTGQWQRSGHGLDVSAGAVAAYRGDGEPRLWVIQPDGAGVSLAVYSPQLFAADYFEDKNAQAQPFLSQTAHFTLTVNGNRTLRPLTDGDRVFGLRSAQFNAPADVAPVAIDNNGQRATLTLHYNPAMPPQGTYRLLVDDGTTLDQAGKPIGPYRYVLEVSLAQKKGTSVWELTGEIQRYWRARNMATLHRTGTVQGDDTLQVGWPQLLAAVMPELGYAHVIRADNTLWSIHSLRDEEPKYVQIGQEQKWLNVFSTGAGLAAIDVYGKLFTWEGYTGHGQGGHGDDVSRDAPYPVASEGQWAEVARSASSTLAIQTDGSLWRWGAIPAHSGLRQSSHTPMRVEATADRPRNWHAIASDSRHALMAIAEDGAMWSFSGGEDPCLRRPEWDQQYVPARIDSSSQWQGISSAYRSLIALDSVGKLWTCTPGATLRRATEDSSSDWNRETWRVAVPLSSSAGMAIRADGSLWKFSRNGGEFLEVEQGRKWLTLVSLVDTGTDLSDALAIEADGSLWWWTSYESLGIGSMPKGKQIRLPPIGFPRPLHRP